MTRKVYWICDVFRPDEGLDSWLYVKKISESDVQERNRVRGMIGAKLADFAEKHALVRFHDPEQYRRLVLSYHIDSLQPLFDQLQEGEFIDVFVMPDNPISKRSLRPNVYLDACPRFERVNPRLLRHYFASTWWDLPVDYVMR